MYKQSAAKLQYIKHRIDGLNRAKAYQKATRNPSMRTCETMGSKWEKRDPRIIPAIEEGLREKQELIKAEQREIYQEEPEKAPYIQPDKLKSVPRDDSRYDLPYDGLPTLAQCGGTVRGHIIRPEPPYRRNKHRDIFVWG